VLTLLVVADWVDPPDPGANEGVQGPGKGKGKGSEIVWPTVVRELKSWVDQQIDLEGLDVCVEMIDPELLVRKRVAPVYSSALAALDPEPEVLMQETRMLERNWATILNAVWQILDRCPATKGNVVCILMCRLDTEREVQEEGGGLVAYAGVGQNSLEFGWGNALRDVREWRESDEGMEVWGDDEGLDFGIEGVPQGEQSLVTSWWIARPLQPHALEDEGKERVTVRRGPVGPEIWLAGNKDEYSLRVDAGHDFSAWRLLSEYPDSIPVFPAVGTIGCWVDVKLPGTGKWITLALTAYHVIRPALRGFRVKADPKRSGEAIPLPPVEGSPCWMVDRYGFGPRPKEGGGSEFRGNWHEDMLNDWLHLPCFQSPSRLRDAITTGDLEKAASSPYKDPDRHRQRLQHNRDFLANENHDFGILWAASGFNQRSSSGSRLDWALIKPWEDKRIGENKLPSGYAWQRQYPYSDADERFPEESTFSGYMKPPCPSYSLRTMPAGSQVFKLSPGTGPTTGISNGPHLKAHFLLREASYMSQSPQSPSPYTSECIIFPPPPDNTELPEFDPNAGLGMPRRAVPFASEGDAGAIVWDREGRVLGMVLDGQLPQQCRRGGGWVAVMPIEDVFGGIRKKLGEGVEVRLSEGKKGECE